MIIDAKYTHLLCRILETEGADFIEHSVVEEEADSAAGAGFLS